MTAIQPLWLPNVNGESMLDSAMAYHRAGLSVIPIKKDSKESLIKWAEYQYRKPTEQEIIAWFGGERGYTKNIGMVTGEISGWSVLDMDAAHNEDEKNGWDLLKENGFQIPKFNEAPIVRTPHGYHVYYEYTPDMKNQTNAWGYKNVDFRNDRGYVILPTSEISCGRYETYEVDLSQPAPLDGEVGFNCSIHKIGEPNKYYLMDGSNNDG